MLLTQSLRPTWSRRPLDLSKMMGALCHRLGFFLLLMEFPVVVGTFACLLGTPTESVWQAIYRFSPVVLYPLVGFAAIYVSERLAELDKTSG